MDPLSLTDPSFRELAEIAPLGILQTTTEGEILFANRTFWAALGYLDFAQLRAAGMRALYSRAEQRSDLVELLRSAGRAEGIEIELVTRSGQPCRFLVSAILQGTILTGWAFDITARAEADQKLRLKEARDATVRRAAETALQARLAQHEAVTRLRGMTLRGDSPQALLDEAARLVAEVLAADAAQLFELPDHGRPGRLRASAGPQFPVVVEDPLVDFTLVAREPVVVEDFSAETRFSGASRCAQGQASAISVSIPGPQRPIGVLCAVSRSRRSFTPDEAHFIELAAAVVGAALARHAADQELRSSEANFRSVLDNIPDAIVMHCKGKIVYVNRKVVSLFDTPREDLLGRSVVEFVHPDDRQVVIARVQHLTQTGELAPPLEERYLQRDGTTLHLEVAALPTEFHGEPAVVAIARDITERKLLAGRVMQMDRMIAVGTLAAGMAHEINNPLAYVIANLDLVAEDLPPIIASLRDAETQRAQLSELVPILAEAREGAERVRKIVGDLKVFSRADDEERRTLVSLPHVIESAINMAWNELRHRARLVKDFGPSPLVEADESRLGQVILNLLVNAAHAIPEGNVEGNEVRIVTRTDKRGYATIEVRDTGCGIPASALPRIFDPFFTTKPVGQGTGLGLSICRNLIHRFGGTIDAESQVDEGTVLRVALPPARREVASTASSKSPSFRPGRRGRILVVDDEVPLGTALRRVLEREHDVVVVTTGREALDLVGREPYDLILCDLMMPEMTGMQLHDILSAQHPDQAARMLFLTGGAFTPQAQEFLDRVPNQRMEKPLDTHKLRAVVRDLVR